MAFPRMCCWLVLFVSAYLVTASALAADGGQKWLTLQSGRLQLQVAADSGKWTVKDAQHGVVWQSNRKEARLGTVTLVQEGKEQAIPLAQFQSEQRKDAIELKYALPGSSAPLRLTFQFAPADVLQLACQCNDPRVRRIRLLDDAMEAKDQDQGGVMMPVRMGMYIRPNVGKNFRHTFRTYEYEGCHCQCAVVRKGQAAALITWNNSDSVYTLESRAVAGSAGPTGQCLLSTLELAPQAAHLAIHFPEACDWATLAQRYRDVARQSGWLVPWEKKLAELPRREALFGASNVKLWTCLARRMDEESHREESVRVHWTFDQAARIAEHLRRDLQLDRVLFILGGWTEGGYDCRHPDNLPANRECGGDKGLADCSRRVRALGYTLGFHDNYQDMYRDARSWGEDWLMKDKAGKPRVGGRWLGGRAYLTCSPKALELAQRPGNLPEVKRLFDPGAYFIDTTYAVGLQECFDPKHPLARADDLHWKQELSRYSRQLFGIFGSECGREWAIPCADFFEGLSGVSGKPYHNVELLPKVGGEVFPFFEMVYRDCIQIYGKYGYEIRQAAPYVLMHALIARPLNYHSIPQGLYWQAIAGQENVAARPSVARFESLGDRRFRLHYRWSVEKPAKGDWRVFVHFTTPAGNIQHGGDHVPRPPVSQWKPGTVDMGPFDVHLPSQIKGPLEIRMGLFTTTDGPRALLKGVDDGERRYRVGRLRLEPGRVVFEPITDVAPAGDAGLFVRGDNGWSQGLHPMDRFLKNTHEILGPLNRRTAQTLMTAYGPLPEAADVLHSQFGDGTEVYANFGKQEASVCLPRWGTVVLPVHGFVAHSRDFLAFCAKGFGGHAYRDPVLFTLTGQDGRPLEQAAKVRVFHGFGESRVKFRGKTFDVVREEVVDFLPAGAAR